MPLSFACPHCQKVVQSNRPVRVGRVVKCPACEEQFAVPGDEQEAIQAKPPPRKVVAETPTPPPDEDTEDGDLEDESLRQRNSKRRDDDEQGDDAPSRKKRRDDNDEEEDAARQRKRRSRDDDEEEEDDEDDRPRRKKRRRKEKASSSVLWISLAGAVFTLAFVAFLITALVWPGFLRSRGASGVDDPLVYLPGDADIIVGVNVASLRSHPDFQKSVDKLFAAVPATPAQKQLLLDADSAIFASNSIAFRTSGVIATRKAQDFEAVRQALNGGPAEKVKGRSIFGGGNGELVALPTPRLLVVSQLSKEQLAALLDKKTPSLKPDLVAQINRVKGNALWLAVPLDGPFRQQLQKVKPDDLKQFPGLDGVTDLIPVLQQSKIFTVHVEIPAGGKSLKLAAGLLCGSDADANKADTALNKVWEKSGKQFLNMAQMFMPQDQDGSKAAKTLLSDVANNLKIKAEGATLTVHLTFSENTLKELEKAGANENPFQANNPGPFRKPRRGR